jgi:mannosyl-3-phosphoglycerate phosphatase
VKIRAIFTDLDGTLLEPDGSLCAEALEEINRLKDRGIPVCLVTSKTSVEVVDLLTRLRLMTPAGFENGAGVILPDGSMVLEPTAIPIVELRDHAAELRTRSGAPLRTLNEIDDAQLQLLTGLPRRALRAVRERRATLPLFVDSEWDGHLRESMPASPPMRLQRGNRFLHLQGNHDKTSVMKRLLTLLPRREGAVVSFGDSPNDLELLMEAEVAVIVPSADGPSQDLVGSIPGAHIAPRPHGRGWVMAVQQIAQRSSPWS